MSIIINIITIYSIVHARIYFEFRACENSALRDRDSLLTPKVPCVARLRRFARAKLHSGLRHARRGELVGSRHIRQTHSHTHTQFDSFCKCINDQRSVINKENFKFHSVKNLIQTTLFTTFTSPLRRESFFSRKLCPNTLTTFRMRSGQRNMVLRA